MNLKNNPNRLIPLILLLFIAGFISCTGEKQRELTVKEVISEKVAELYQTKNQEELTALTYEEALGMFSPEEKKILATRHWMFDVNVPVVVSVIRSKKQEIVPFWLPENGFKKTDLSVSNEMTEYEIWQKPFDTGRVGLGINGLENYSLHYFVCVGPQKKGDQLKLSNFYPENQYVGTMDDGAFTYHDWTELVLTDVPDELKGQALLTTIRGRGVETHLVKGFRETVFPSSAAPDQVMLTWSSNPSTSIDIQWRTDTTVANGTVKYRVKGANEILSVEAEKYRMEDLMLMNDRFIHRFTAHLEGLKPGTAYEYRMEPQTGWSEKQTFTTAGEGQAFSFAWFGDTHHSPEFGKMFSQVTDAWPGVAFYSIAGDLVSNGLHRDEWDDLFEFMKNGICQKPLMSVPGNHDNRLGLGAKMYRDMFSYPLNGPEGVEKEQTYSFTYKNTLFLMIDATSPVDVQSGWIENQLKNTKATWKVAIFHFPPYNWEEPYLDIQQAWVPLFDQYHVDLVFGGHLHYYMRSRPMKAGRVVDSYSDGTAYIISIAIPSHHDNMTDEPYAAVRKPEGQFYQVVDVDGNRLTYRSFNSENQLIDSFSIKK